jgi:hypothetical protein
VPLIYLMFLNDFDVIPTYSYIAGDYCLGIHVQTSMSCMHERGQSN